MNLEEKKKLLIEKIAEIDDAYLIENMLNLIASEETIEYKTASETHKKRMDDLLERSIELGLKQSKKGNLMPYEQVLKDLGE